jgi:hypothetical protein
MIKHNEPFLSGVYFYKHTTQVVATWCVDNKTDLCTNVPIQAIQSAAKTDTLIKIRGCGFGCVLLHKSIFDNIPFEWDFDERQGEDIRYCQRCNDAGHNILLDPQIMCKHMSDSDFNITKKR